MWSIITRVVKIKGCQALAFCLDANDYDDVVDGFTALTNMSIIFHSTQQLLPL